MITVRYNIFYMNLGSRGGEGGGEREGGGGERDTTVGGRPEGKKKNREGRKSTLNKKGKKTGLLAH